MTKEEVHQKWCALTDNGKNDRTVFELEREFERFETKLRARYNVTSALVQSAKVAAVHHVKLHLIHGGKAGGL
jgi:hypothetical protein